MLKKIKSTIYRIEVAITFLVLCYGIVLTLRLFIGSDNIIESVIALVNFAGYLISYAMMSIVRAQSIALVSVFFFCLYIGSLYYFSQTENEKKYIKVVIPVAVAAVLFCSIGVFGYFFASQGAGL